MALLIKNIFGKIFALRLQRGEKICTAQNVTVKRILKVVLQEENKDTNVKTAVVILLNPRFIELLWRLEQKRLKCIWKDLDSEPLSA